MSSVEVVCDGEGYAWRVPLPDAEMLRGRALEARHPSGTWMRRWSWQPDERRREVKALLERIIELQRSEDELFAELARLREVETRARAVAEEYRDALDASDDLSHVEIGTYLGHSLTSLARAVDAAVVRPDPVQGVAVSDGEQT